MNSNPQADDDRLSRYLAGELSDDEVGELEERCAADPTLAARLDALHDALWTLRQLDGFDPPAGYLDRLRARIAHERDELGAGAAAPERPVRRPRPKRAGLPPRARLGWAVGAAAGLAAAALIAGGVVRGLGGAADEDVVGGPAAPRAGEASRALQGQVDDGEAAQGPDDLRAEREAFDDGTGQTAGAPILADETAVRARFAGNPAARSLLGTPRPAGDLTREPEAEDRSEPNIPSSEPSCPAAAGAISAAQAVTVAVESVVYRGSPRLALVVVDASPGSAVLDRIAVVMVDPASCAIRERVDLTAGGE